ncbi:Ras-related protein Rab-1A [Geosmithia morbida]|uniref:Aminopeptidase n=1 Tax=Geosmithia morbida TaxID=1094350 RepID=A0A9P4Z111_9HYPO|nr:Ras-related protein Rab-1A [Geosmithia morbida]KAF4125454.1 Ras-related protein Rab-1A [Geosmithia morbida]
MDAGSNGSNGSNGNSTTPQLPSNSTLDKIDHLVPSAYRLSIYDVRFAPDWNFRGTVAIDGQVTRPISEICLHAVGIRVSRVELSGDSGDAINLSGAATVSDGLLRIRLADQLAPGNVTLTIGYQASIGDSMSGFYRARYRSPPPTPNAIRDGDDSVVLSTHFEPCYARETFPCFDQPHLKATFDIDVEAPDGLTVLSNMPARDEVRLDGVKSGLKRVTFERTPVMSTYLLVWAMADLEYIEGSTRETHRGSRVPVRVYTPPGLARYADFALDCASRVIDLYRDLFSIDYPVSKSDHLIVPEFVSGAMENWGLITYKPTKILFDPATSNNRVRSKAAYVVAHELAHQWFGNLVTMYSWTELWLNEGFATWAGYTAVDHLYPEMDIWSQYVAEIMDDVMKLDSLPTTHAIVAEVEDENAALQMFDQISYFKAGSVLRMLSDHIGPDAFFRGLTDYLNRHAYRNATSEDLWDALSLVSGVDVSKLMDTWIHTPSFPIVCLDPHDRSRVVQRSILPAGEDDAPSVWDVPVKLLTDQGKGLAVNTAHVGYFCIDYDVASLSKAISGPTGATSTDIVGIICDLGTLALNSSKPTSDLLEFIWALKGSDDGSVWLAISRSLFFIRSIFADDDAIQKDLKIFTAHLIHDVRSKLVWGKKEMGYTEAELFKTIIGLGFVADDETIVKETRSSFDRWAAGDASSIVPSLRGAVLSSCVSTGTAEDFEAVQKAFEADPSLDGQEIILSAMGSVGDAGLAIRVLDYAFASDRNVSLQHVPLLGIVMGQNIRCRGIQWDYVKRNWSSFKDRLGRNSTCRDWWIEEALRHFSDIHLADEAEAFFDVHFGASTKKQVEYIRASIVRNAAYKEFAREDVSRWLKSRQY